MSNLNTANSESKEQLVEGQGQFMRMAHDTGVRVGKATSAYVETTRSYIKDNPAKSVAMTALAGGLLGSLVTLALQRYRQK